MAASPSGGSSFGASSCANESLLSPKKPGNDSGSGDDNDVEIRRFLFLNTHLFAGTFAATFARNLAYYDADRAAAISRLIMSSGADFVALCEVWSTSLADSIARSVARLYNSMLAFRGSAFSPLMGGGILLLCKKPKAFDKCTFVNFEKLAGWDAFACKGVSSVVVDGVRIIVTHLQAGFAVVGSDCYSNPNAREILDCREENMRKVLSVIPDGNEPVILMGDMNIAELNLDYTAYTGQYSIMCEQLASKGLRDAFRMLHPLTFSPPSAVPMAHSTPSAETGGTTGAEVTSSTTTVETSSSIAENSEATTTTTTAIKPEIPPSPSTVAVTTTNQLFLTSDSRNSLKQFFSHGTESYRLDYFFVRNILPLEVAVQDNTSFSLPSRKGGSKTAMELSDHYPISGRFRILH